MSNRQSADDIARLRREAYGRVPSATARRIEVEVLGRNVGLGGYTTVDQARELATELDASRGDRVLDLGTGRGWPGSEVAATTECRLVATDIPVEALLAARQYLAIGGQPGQTRLAAADGTALPFRSGVFAAVTHADVFC